MYQISTERDTTEGFGITDPGDNNRNLSTPSPDYLSPWSYTGSWSKTHSSGNQYRPCFSDGA